MDHDLRLTVSSMRPDCEIAHDAVERLHGELPFSSEFMKVTIEHGWLTLEGDIEWSYQRDRAERAVLVVRGVMGVLDNLRRRPRVVAHEVKRQIEDALKKSVERGANCSTAEPEGSGVIGKGVRSWAMLDGFSVHRESVRR